MKFNEKLKSNADPEMREFEEALLRSIERALQQAQCGEGRIHTPEQIMARRASGKGWQTRAAQALAQLAPRSAPKGAD